VTITDEQLKEQILSKNEHRIDIEAEGFVLGGMMKYPSIIPEIVSIVGNDGMGRGDHRVIFEAVMALYADDVPIDVISVARRLKVDGLLGRAGGAVACNALVENCPAEENITYYAEIVKDLHVERMLLDVNKIIPQVIKDNLSLSEKLMKIDKHFSDIIGLAGKYTPLTHAAQVNTTLDWWDNQFDKETAYEIPTGFASFDIETLGLHRGEYAIIAGVPSAGKSCFALNIVLNAWLEHKIATQIVNYEEPVRMIHLRMASIISGVPLAMVRAVCNSPNAQIKKGDTKYTQVVEALQSVADMPYPIVTQPGPNIAELKLLTKRCKKQDDRFGILYVDHIQIAPAIEGQREYDKVTEFSMGLKEIAIASDIAVLGISQLNRAVGNTPKLENLRSSGGLGQDADLVCFLSNVSDEPQDDKTIRKILNIAKQRNGPTGDIQMDFHTDCLRFVEI